MTKVLVRDMGGTKKVPLYELCVGDFFRWRDRVFVISASFSEWERGEVCSLNALELGSGFPTAMNFPPDEKVEHINEVNIDLY